jgi:hypothetical protein
VPGIWSAEKFVIRHLSLVTGSACKGGHWSLVTGHWGELERERRDSGSVTQMSFVIGEKK